jgi:excisionase family DNA binding protein
VARSNAELASAEILVLTIEEAAKVLRLSTDSAYEAARRGEIPTLRIGRRVLVPKRALLNMIDGRGPGGTA